MLWTYIERITNICVLLLVLTLLGKVGLLAKEQNDSGVFDKKVMLLQEESKKVIGNNLYYLESRINKLSEAQDDYQNSSFSRMSVLELKIKKIEKEHKASNKVINNNINTINNK